MGRCGITTDDREDLEQEMTLDLLLRLEKYNPTKGKLSTFINLIVNRRAATILRSRSQMKRHYRTVAWSLDEPFDCEEGVGGTRHGEAG